MTLENQRKKVRRPLHDALNDMRIRSPHPRRLFILDESEVKNLITGALLSQFLVFLGGILANSHEYIALSQGLLLSTEWIGYLVSSLGFLSWGLTVYKKLDDWKKESGQETD